MVFFLKTLVLSLISYYESKVCRMLPMYFNKNINKMFDFGTLQYDLHESSRKSLYFFVLFIDCVHFKLIFDKKF